MKSYGTPLKKFQDTAVKSAVRTLGECLSLVAQSRGTVHEALSRNTAVSNFGYVLFEAPTGIGKTLMAGTTIEELSSKYKVVWFWFAPFSGLIDQSIGVIRDEHQRVRPKALQTDRVVEDLSPGDVFVTTWQSLAVSNSESRKARKGTETQLSVDRLIEQAKLLGFSIGVVIDEAHHSFRSLTQAYQFYQQVICPDVTLLATATPRDRDIERFLSDNRISHLHRVSISRQQGVDAGLLKRGVKVGVFRPEQGFENFVDMQLAALEYGVESHRRLKQLMQEKGVPLTPLLLVQADSTSGSIARVEGWLRNLGFREGQFRSHTSDEPDPHLLAIAADEEVEVLVFKMAVAMGFDVPRAHVLVSMRNTVDPDWGIQIVGRIMRVHRAMQGVQELPQALQYGYVFMSNHEGQAGLTEAASRINSLRDELSPVTEDVAIFEIGEDGLTVQEVSGGQPTFFPAHPRGPVFGEHSKGVEPRTAVGSNTAEQPSFPEFQMEPALSTMGLDRHTSKTASDSKGRGTVAPANQSPTVQRYPLRVDIDYPKAFMKAVTNPNQDEIIDDLIQALRLQDVLSHSLRDRVNVQVVKTEIFEGAVEDPERFQVVLEDENLAKTAQMALNLADRDGYIDPKDLRVRIEKALKEEYRSFGMSEADDHEKIRRGVDRLIALYPTRFKNAVRMAIHKNTTVLEADPLPAFVESFTPLKPSRLNLYRIYPDDLGPWEKSFAEVLDGDTSDTVLWWHRNPSRKRYSISIPVPGFDNYYPDFAVGVRDRRKGNGLILVETKERINDADGLAHAKAQSHHPLYLRPLMLYLKDGRDWHTVEYDADTGKNILDRLFRVSLLKSYP